MTGTGREDEKKKKKNKWKNEKRKRERERERWNWWTDKKLGELFQIVRLLLDDLRSCYRKLRVKGAVRVYWLRQSRGKGERHDPGEEIFAVEKYLENGGAYSVEIRMIFRRIRKGRLICAGWGFRGDSN